MMPTLAECQRAWIGALRQPEDAIRYATAVAGWQGGQRSGAQALAVYVNNSRATLIQALSLSYPLSLRHAGTSLFHRAAVRCLRDYPPRSGDLGEYGADFPAVLRDTAAEMHRDDAAWLADLARCEWLLDQLPRKTAHPAWTRADSTALAPEHWLGLRLSLAPQAACFIGDEPAYTELAEAFMAQASDATGFPLCEYFSADGECEGLLLVAQTGSVQLLGLRADECAWVARLQDSPSMMAATEATLTRWPGFDLLSLLSRLFDAGALLRITDDGEME
ncbi:MAG: putative DNA-binding domain-containing protein [Gammaproteobacteria bacterium]|nr:putative DNA-binding domain-containing protein [Gammaproteobacteria bacterium]